MKINISPALLRPNGICINSNRLKGVFYECSQAPLESGKNPFKVRSWRNSATIQVGIEILDVRNRVAVIDG